MSAKGYNSGGNDQQNQNLALNDATAVKAGSH